MWLEIVARARVIFAPGLVPAALPHRNTDDYAVTQTNGMEQAGARRGPGIGRRWRWRKAVVMVMDGDGDVNWGWMTGWGEEEDGG